MGFRLHKAAAWLVRGLIAGAGLLMCYSEAHAFGPFPSILNPRTYRSPSGEYELLVNPTHRYGKGSGWYRLRRNGREIWGGKRPFTMWEAAVADDGTVGGYAYLGGDVDPKQHFAVVVIAPAGRTVTDHRTPRSPIPDSHPTPYAQGLFLDPVRRQLVVKVDVKEAGIWWWGYPLSESRSQAGPVHKFKGARNIPQWVRDAQNVPRPAPVLPHLPTVSLLSARRVPGRPLISRGRILLQADSRTSRQAPFREGEHFVLGSDRQLYFLEARTRSIHVFDREGRALRVLRAGAPLPAESLPASITLAPAGSIHLIGSGMGLEGSRVAVFGRAGSFEGWRRVQGDLYLRWHYQPGINRRWEIDSERIILRSARGAVLRETERHSDQTWLEEPEATAVAPDGTLVWLGGTPGAGRPRLSLFAPNGHPKGTFNLPEKGDSETGMQVACNSRHIFVVDRNSVLALDLKGKPLWRSAIPAQLIPEKSVLQPAVDPVRRELLLYNGQRTLYRFAL